MYHRLPTSKARQKFAEILTGAGYQRRRVMLERHGKNIAAVIPPEDLELLEALENRMDLEAVRAALREGGKPISLEDMRAELGL
jgi:PHD/YefM family antitoxin component YafN of YafNO toxin-antitoxin module